MSDPSEIPVLPLSELPVSSFKQMGLVPETKVRILEALEEEPAHGYLLAEKLGLSHGYIYTHLKELREEGMIEVVEESEGKKVYGLTQNGEYLLLALTDLE
ncbi:winged helix-turn-helix domain-containing protein [Salarchaeum japonicum]|uniref:winged helix-turn-helix domain-containing protein n=1 Tax=Salarchaeum japonicum TaxID=555573 RepID=UPI003C74B0C6